MNRRPILLSHLPPRRLVLCAGLAMLGSVFGACSPTNASPATPSTHPSAQPTGEPAADPGQASHWLPPTDDVNPLALPVTRLEPRVLDGSDLGAAAGSKFECQILVVGDAGLELIGGVSFGTNQFDLTAETIAQLDSVVAPLLGEDTLVHAIGHADRRPSSIGNDILSERRAQAVADYLRALETGALVTFAGKGDSEPVDLGDTAAAHAANRRVELFVCTEEGP